MEYAGFLCSPVLTEESKVNTKAEDEKKIIITVIKRILEKKLPTFLNYKQLLKNFLPRDRHDGFSEKK